MDKLSQTLRSIKERYTSLSNKTKIIALLAILATIIAITSLFYFTKSNKYQLLFSNLEATDAQIVIKKLDDEKVDYTIKGSSIYVEKGKVDTLRLNLAPELTSGSDGYELMDTGSSFGMSDEELKIKKTRMLQGELEKTIKSFPQIEDARIHITEAEDSVFIEDNSPGKAAVYIKLKDGLNLSNEQIKSIIALVSGGTKNIPMESIEIIDQNMNLLSSKISFDENNIENADSVSQQQLLEQKYEEQLKETVISLLEPVLGKDRIKVAINADLNFDSNEHTITELDPNKVMISQDATKEVTSNPENSSSSNSPVDNNMENSIDESESTSNTTSEHTTTNYDTGKKEIKIIKAPGEVERVTASVLVDGEIDNNTKLSIEEIVGNAIGYNELRNDSISVMGINFYSTAKAEDEKAQNAFNEMQEKQSSSKSKYIYIGGAIVGLVILFITIVAIIRRKKDDIEEEVLGSNINMVIGDDNQKDSAHNEGINIEIEGGYNKQVHLENEIKKYAKEKPEQVLDIVKSWIVESER